jgi:hypothetical protein
MCRLPCGPTYTGIKPLAYKCKAGAVNMQMSLLYI